MCALLLDVRQLRGGLAFAGFFEYAGDVGRAALVLACGYNGCFQLAAGVAYVCGGLLTRLFQFAALAFAA